MSLIHYSFSKTSTCTRPIINSIKSGNYYQFSSRSSRDGPTTRGTKPKMPRWGKMAQLIKSFLNGT